MDSEEGLSWQTADLLSADTTDVLAADTTDVLPADTTDALPADNPAFLWRDRTHILGFFAGNMQQMCFSPRGSVWSFEGWVLLRISLGLAVRTFWSDLQKHKKSTSGEILKGRVNILGWGAFGSKNDPEKSCFVEE